MGSWQIAFLVWLWQLIAVARVCGQTQCSPCGNQTVPYPLSTSPQCGHPRYSLSCVPAISQLQLHAISGSYIVRDIVPALQLLVLSLSPLSSNGASCMSHDLSHGGLVLNQSQPFSVTSANSLIFFNCTQLLLQSPLNCTASSPCNQAFAAAGAMSCRSLLCCSVSSAGPSNRYWIPLNESACSAYTSVVNMNQSLSVKKWDFGVQLKWDLPTEPPCTSQSQCPTHSVCSTNGTSSANVCLCSSGYNWDPFTGQCQEGVLLRHKKTLIAALTPSLFVVLLGIAILTIAYWRRRCAKQAEKAKISEERSRILSAHGAKATLYSAKEMKAATDNFSRDRLLGSGGFGEVYKGVLNDGTVVAIKAAKLGNVKGNNQVLNEVRILSQVNHRNLVRLLGCCIETEQPLMVYEYVPNGTLFDHLAPSLGGLKQTSLNWERRLCIALETSEGLGYLHSSAYPPIIHRDVKSSNILLDVQMTAKVSDFGLSRLVEPDLTHISTCAQGTLGYLDPHYYRNYQLTDKSDVYSFGVVLLELVTSQQAIDFTRDTEDVNLVVYVGERAERGCVDEVLDPWLVGSSSEAEILSMKDVVELALACLQEDGSSRPRMKEVSDRLNSIVQALGIERHSLPRK